MADTQEMIDELMGQYSLIVDALGGETRIGDRAWEVEEFLKAFKGGDGRIDEIFHQHADQAALILAALMGQDTINLPGKEERGLFQEQWEKEWPGGTEEPSHFSWALYELSRNMTFSFMPKGGLGYVEVDLQTVSGKYGASPLEFPLEVEVSVYMGWDEYCGYSFSHGYTGTAKDWDEVGRVLNKAFEKGVPVPRMLTEEEFDKEFEPVPAPDGGGLWTFDEVKEAEIPDHRVWTATQDEVVTYAPGVGFVNVIGFVVSTKPWTECGNTVVILDY